MNVGGRIIEIDHNTLIIRYIAEPARKIIQERNLPIAVGREAELGPLREFCNVLAELTVELILGTESPLAHQVMLTPPMSVTGLNTKLFISGGVGYYFYHPLETVTLESVTQHDDIGPLFGLALKENLTLQEMEAVEPPETIRATVIGAELADGDALGFDDLGGERDFAHQECAGGAPEFGNDRKHSRCAARGDGANGN